MVDEEGGRDAVRQAKAIVLSSLEDFDLHAALESDNRFMPSHATLALINAVLVELPQALENDDPDIGVAALAKVSTLIAATAQLAAGLIRGLEEKGATGLWEQLEP